MKNIFTSFSKKLYKLFERKLSRKLWSCTDSTVFCKLRSEGYKSQLNCNHKLKACILIDAYYCYNGVLCTDISNSMYRALNLQNQGEWIFGNEKNENQAGCLNKYNHIKESMSSDTECLGLNRLFDMEQIVKNVKSNLKEKRENRLKACNASEKNNERRKWKKGRKGKNSNERSQKDDSDSSFGLVTLFDQAKTVHKRQRKSKKGNKNEKKSKDETYGLEWLFSEKNIDNRKSRKRKKVNYNIYESDEDGEIEEIKIKKKRPNHFVAIRISNPAIHLAIKGFQDAVLKENEKLKPALIPLISLHITIAVMHLDETTIKIAQDALEKCKDKISDALQAIDHKLIFSGVGNFNNETVFAKLHEKEQVDCLKNINSVVTTILEEDGICLADKKEYNPHLTLLKLSRKSSLRKNGIKKVDESIYASWHDSYFGEELVENVHLCSMQGKKEDDGFYKCLSTITFCNDS